MSGYEPRMPSAVRKAGEAADAALEELRKQGEGGEAPDAGIPQDPKTPEAGEGGEAPGEGTPQDPSEGEGVLDWKVEFEKLTAKFNVLQGKYNSEVPVLHQQLKDKDAEIAQLKEGGATGPGESGKPVEFKPNADEKELVDLYGEDFVKYVKAEAGRLVGEAVAPLRDKFDTMDKNTSQAVEQNFYEALQEAHSDWEAINLTEGWIVFLNEVDPASGLTRQEIIDRAQDAGDPAPVIYQMTEFKKRNKSGSERMSDTAVPGDTGVTPKVEQDDKVYAASSIRQFYKDVASGRYRGKEDEAARLEVVFAKAHQEGRIDESA